MNEDTNNEAETPGSENAPLRSDTVAPVQSRGRKNRTAIVTLVVVVAILAVAVSGWLIWSNRSSRAGRPVPAPRSISNEQQATTTTPGTEPSITIEPEVASRAGIKIEAVGQALIPGSSSSGQPTTGVVQPNAYRTTPVVSLVGGILRRVNAELGKQVSQGETMAVVFSDELAKAQSEYLTAVAELEEHHKHHNRTMRLLEIGAASREELEQAATKLRTAESEVASKRQRLVLLGLNERRIAQLKSPEQISGEVSFPAPVSGSVISRSANPGEVIGADKELLRIADLSSVWVLGQVYEKDLAKVVVGSGAAVTSEAYPGRIFRGRVSYVDPTLDQTTRTAQARIELANPKQVLKIGMFVNVSFDALGASQTTAATVPKSAVQNLNDQQVVFVALKEANAFAMRPVKLGPEVNGQYPVLEGLTVGERVVTDGSFLVRAEWLKRNQQ